LAVTVLLVAMLAATASTLRMHALRRTNRERVLAQNAVRSVSERLQSLAARGVADPAGWSTTVLAGIAATGEIGPGFDGDGAAANPDVSVNATLLPVIVRARWHGAAGDGEIVHAFYLSRF
jgi:hypothetical protein